MALMSWPEVVNVLALLLERFWPKAFSSHVSFAKRSEEHTSELQSQSNLVCRLLLEKKNQIVFQGRNPQWTLPPICFLYVHSSRWLRTIRSTLNSAMEIDQSICHSDLIYLPCDPAHSGCGFSLE